jgi:hypothetical protein
MVGTTSGFYKNGKLQGEWVSLIVMVIKQPWQHMIMVRSPENGFWNDTVLSEVDYSNNQILLKIEARCFSDRSINKECDFKKRLPSLTEAFFM